MGLLTATDLPKGSLVARVRLVPETDEERDSLGLCRGSARAPIAGTLVEGDRVRSGDCGGCGARVALESDGLVANHPA